MTMKRDILNPGFELTLRPMQYPELYDRFRDAIKNTWTIDEVDFSTDINDLKNKMTPAQRHMVERLVAFFATGDTIVANNACMTLYRHLNSPSGRLFLSRQIFEEANHILGYVVLLDTYLPDHNDRAKAFAAIENIPSIKKKADFCFKWMDSTAGLDRLETLEDRRNFILNLTCFATCVEGLFFYGAFAYVYFLRSIGLLPGLADLTNWVFRDESGHFSFALEVLEIIRSENPQLFDDRMADQVREMIKEAVECEYQFAQDVLEGGISGMSLKDMRSYLENVADQRLVQLGYEKEYHSKNPFDFMVNQDAQGVANFFERRNSSYQLGVEGKVDLEQDF